MQQQEGGCKVPQVRVQGQGVGAGHHLAQDVWVSPPLWGALQDLERQSRRMKISPGSPLSSRLLAARDLPGCGQLLVQPHLDLPFQGWEEELGWCGSLRNPVASSICRISSSWPGHREEYPARLETAGDKSGQVERRGPALCQVLDMFTLFWSTGVRQVRPLPGAQASNHCFWGTARSPSTCQEDLIQLHALNGAGLVPYLEVF